LPVLFHTIYIKVSQASIIFPMLAGLIYYKRLDKSFKILVGFVLASILFEVQASTLKEVYHNNMPGLHLFTFCEFITFTIVYGFYFSKYKVLSRLIIINAIMFICIAVADAFLINGIWQPNNISRTYSSISLVCLSLTFFYHLFNNDNGFYSWQYPMFWFSTGVLIYFALNLFYFMLNNYLIQHAFSLAYNSMRVHAAINIISNCLLAKSFLCFKESTRKY
jgi:hypothetical protein